MSKLTKVALYLVALAIIGAVATVMAQSPEDDDDDDGGVDMYLHNPRVVKQQIKCISGTGLCDSVGQQIKKHLPDALFNDCRRCNKRNARIARKIIDFMEENYPADLKRIRQMYRN